MILVSGPAIASLCRHTRKWAHDAIRRGRFGPIAKGYKGILYVRLDAVESAYGITFSKSQIERAAAGIPTRVLERAQTGL